MLMELSGIAFELLHRCHADTTRCMTTTAGDPVLELEYPKAFADAILPSLVKRGRRFRYLHLSGALVERDQKKSLWMKANVRKIKVCVIRTHCNSRLQ